MSSLVNKVHRIETAFQEGGSLYFPQEVHKAIPVEGHSLDSLLKGHSIEHVLSLIHI